LEKYKAKNRQFVSDQEAWVKYEADFPFPPSLIWEYLTKPDLEAGFQHYDYAERTDTSGGRIREGSGFHCAHGDLHVHSKILDWKPFEYYTMDQTALGLSYISTRRLTQLDHGTRLSVYLTRPAENPSEEVHRIFQSAIYQGYAGLETFIEQDIKSGKITAS